MWFGSACTSVLQTLMATVGLAQVLADMATAADQVMAFTKTLTWF
jgi:hypothetical protein